jgi:hypothetical protein
MRMARADVAALLLPVAAVLAVGCGGRESPSAGLTVAGAVYDISTANMSPVLGATVTLRRAQDDAPIAVATTGGDGSFLIQGVPASTDVYLDAGKASYTSFDYGVLNTTTGVSGVPLYIALAANVQHEMDLIAWQDPTNGDYSSRSWFVMDIYDAGGAEVPGLTVTVDPADVTVLYNNGVDVFLSSGPTTALSSHSAASLVGGYGAATGVHTFTVSDGSRSKALKLPLVHGEMTYASIYPW